MNYTTDINGNPVIAVGSPGSPARMKAEGRFDLAIAHYETLLVNMRKIGASPRTVASIEAALADAKAGKTK